MIEEYADSPTTGNPLFNSYIWACLNFPFEMGLLSLRPISLVSIAYFN